ncbi:MAG: T9SS type A sorting domain-containing protein [Prevotellaceae bacterium]|jgi:alpha-amylase|nr:T9SS type A sorting domain-containing protein [Prevotellaceae bacterium]
MKKFSTFFAVVLFYVSTVFSQVPAQCGDVMIQAFMYDSVSLNSWYNLYYSQAGDISRNFDLVWLAPSANSTGGTGYIPLQWSNQNSAMGTEAELKRLINYFHHPQYRVNVIADIIVNHRGAASESGIDFYPDNFGTFGNHQLITKDICNNDEAVSEGYMTAAQGGNADEGDNFDGVRDLDHKSTRVQNAIKAYLQWLKTEIGYDGWRYDMVKGFWASRVGDYNDVLSPYLSVGENMDGDYNVVWNWIKYTGQNGQGYKSMAFDFPMKYRAIKNGLQNNNYSEMQWLDGSTQRPAGLVHSWESRKYTVTFVDNHDTWRMAEDKTPDLFVEKAYAFIMSSPGVPCVFLKNWIDHKDAISAMIKARKIAGIHSESDVEVQEVNSYYKAYSKGKHGAMLTYIGNDFNLDWLNTPESANGWTLECSGSGWAILVNTTAASGGENPSNAGRIAYEAKREAVIDPTPEEPQTNVTFRVVTPSNWASANIYLWEKNGEGDLVGVWNAAPAMIAEGNNTFRYTFDNSVKNISTFGVVFSYRTATDTVQTIDLAASATTCWVLENTPTQAGKYNAAVSEDCVSSALHNTTTKKIVIYPNPVTSELQITNYELKGNENVIITDVSGKIVMTYNFPLTSINVSALSQGIYFVKIGTHIEKFVKK